MSLKTECNSVLSRVVKGSERVPGVVAMVTDRNENIFSGAMGDRSVGGDPITEDTIFAIFSTTKAVAGTAALQCVEEGLLDLDAPAKTYAPAIGELQVLEGFGADGQPKLRPPKTDVTTRQLLLHTAGLAYEFFNERYKKLSDDHGQVPVTTCTMDAIKTPLLFDPGERWEYGTNIDWVGQVVEGIRGKRLGQVMRERIFDPLEMNEIAFTRTDAMKAKTASIHARGEDGFLTPTDLALPDNPEVDMGGHGLYGTVPEYMKFIRMWLNDGEGPKGRVLRSETVEWAVKGALVPPQKVTMMPGVIPELTHDAEFFPGLAKDWSYSFMVNSEAAPTGRPAGTIGWAGLANCFYWIDRQNGLGGFWATQVLPFVDPVSFNGYMDFETAVYSEMMAAKAA
ncbi:beta-lactamase family protein [Tateyamaria omphalii]|uniref:serine hydrolase domain-containing protein n=1 Tax=Tateyamaria omphalii TaxID=299262 RepID=UPI001C98FB47|nr:serine hydrolase domain-containing protein [Tateyamaria omphalii]MBY5935115.1 beta-lactamase family protein [Tateyamaria omphalii]